MVLFIVDCRCCSDDGFVLICFITFGEHSEHVLIFRVCFMPVRSKAVICGHVEYPADMVKPLNYWG